MDTKLDGVSNQMAENWRATQGALDHGTKRGRPDKEVDQRVVKVNRKKDEVIAVEDDDYVMVDVEISSMIPKGTGFAISFKADGVDRDLSICNFFTEFPDFVFESEHIEMLRKKYESLQDNSGSIGKVLLNYLNNAAGDKL